MILSLGSAVFFSLFAGFLFAFWYQSLKHLNGYPISAFAVWLNISSFITVLIAFAFLQKHDLPEGLTAALDGKALMVLGTIAGGLSMTYGLIISLVHMDKYGMIANQAVMGSVGAILSLALTFVVGGLNEGVSLLLVLISASVLIAASVVTQYSSTIKKSDKSRKNEAADRRDDLKQNLILIFSNLLLMGYSVAYMLCTKSAQHPEGFPPLLCVLLLSVGSLMASLTYAAVSLTRNRQWSVVFGKGCKMPILLGLGSGVCHYGGNLMHIYALPLLSAPVSMLLTKTSNLWTYIWGLLYGEYKNSSKKSKLFLVIGILLYVVGILMLTYALYR